MHHAQEGTTDANMQAAEEVSLSLSIWEDFDTETACRALGFQ